jgi:hypothetical protein
MKTHREIQTHRATPAAAFKFDNTIVDLLEKPAARDAIDPGTC